VAITENSSNGQASWVRQSIGITLGVLALIGFLIPTMAAIVRPIEMQIQSNQEDVRRHAISDSHSTSGKNLAKLESEIKALEEKVVIQMNLSHKLLDERDINLKERIISMERNIITRIELLHKESP
jgi:hypothetical protein